MSHVSNLREIGAGIIGRAVTDTLYVSPEGAGSNGKTWAGAFTTIQDALDAASTDADECTLILISPHTSNYNINTTGDPTWTGNYILQGTHRNWAKIKNEHGTATSVMKFTGKVSLMNLNINLGTGNNGIIMTHGGVRVRDCQFVGVDLTSAKTCLWLDHASTGKHAKLEDIDFLGNITYCRAILIDNFAHSHISHTHIHQCLEGIQIVGATSDYNVFKDIEIGDCSHANGIGINIDAGNEQHFNNVTFHHNKANVTDVTRDHTWTNIRGQFPITIMPDDLDGVTATVANGAGFGDAVALISPGIVMTPFRVVGVHVEPTASEWHQVRFSVDASATFYDVVHFEGNKREGIAAPSGTEFIFNGNLELTAAVKNETANGTDTCQVWIEIQII